MSVALAAQLREGTKKSHTMAENTGFVSCFLKGVVDKASYRKLVADLYFVYTAMEEEIAKLGDHPVVGPVGMQELSAGGWPQLGSGSLKALICRRLIR